MNKWKVLDHEYLDQDSMEMVKIFDPHPGQLEIVEHDALYKVASCGRRFGKSNLGGKELVPWAIQAKIEAAALAAQGRRREFWIVGPEYADSEKEFRVFYDTAKKLGFPFDRPGTYYSVKTGDMSVSLWDGAFILHAKSEARPTSLVGEGLSGVIMAEAAKMKENTWLQYIMPSLADFNGFAYFTTTPEGKNWFYRLYLEAMKDGKLNWNGWRMPCWRNPFVYTIAGRAGERDASRIPPEQFTKDEHVRRLLHIMNEHPSYSAFEIAASKKLQIDPTVVQAANNNTIPMFTQEYAADFTDFVGKVFKEFDEETHSRLLPFNRNWETVAAVDYGYCVDTETEILTKSGWKRHDQVVEGEECLTLNTKTNLAEWGNILHVSTHNGRFAMKRMKSKSHDSFSTDSHRWRVKWLNNQKEWNWRWKMSENFTDNDYIPTALPVTNLPETQKYSDALVELIAWYWTEGSRWSFGKGNHRGVNLGGEITQNTGPNLESIKTCLYQLYGNESETLRDGKLINRQPKWRVDYDYRRENGAKVLLNGPALAPILEHVRGFDKIVDYNFIALLTKAQLELFIKTSIDADGSIRKKSGTYYISQSKWERLEPLQMACQLAGYQTVLRKEENGYGSLTIFIRYNQFHPKSIVQDEEWEGTVWCPTTNNGTWLARRNGTVYFTGNRNPNVWLLIQIGPYGEINVIDELYQENLAPDEFAQEVIRRGLCPDNLTWFYPDPALPGDTKTLENIFRRNGRRATSRHHTGGELQDRLNLIRLALKDRITDTELSQPQWQSHPPQRDKRRPRLMISTKCPMTLHEFGEYRYPDKKDEQQETSTKRFELPMKKDDHTPEALGRMLASRYHDMSTQYGNGTRVSKARFLSSLGNTRYDHAGGVPAGIPSRHTTKRRGNWMSGR